MLAKFFEFFGRPTGKNPATCTKPNAQAIDVLTAMNYGDMSEICREIEQAYTGLLLGVHSLDNGDMNRFEKTFLASVKKVYMRDEMPEALLPRLPMVVPKAMQALRNSKTDANGLAKILSSDIVLVAELIRLANSAYYARSQVLTSLEDAIVSVGFNGIRQMIIAASLKPILSAHVGHFVKNSSRYLWDMSMGAGLLGDAAAGKMNVNRFHAYLACMTSQTGTAVLIQHLDQYFDGKESPRSREFVDRFNQDAAEVSIKICQQWQLPDQVISAHKEQLAINSPYDMSFLGRIAFFSKILTKIRILKANGHSSVSANSHPLKIDGKLGEVFAQLEEEHLYSV